MASGVENLMKSKIIVLLMLMAWLAGPGAVAETIASESAGEVSPVIENQPVVFLPENQYRFAPVLEGTPVTHTFVIKNKGTAPLEIQKVRTG